MRLCKPWLATSSLSRRCFAAVKYLRTSRLHLLELNVQYTMPRQYSAPKILISVALSKTQLTITTQLLILSFTTKIKRSVTDCRKSAYIFIYRCCRHPLCCKTINEIQCIYVLPRTTCIIILIKNNEIAKPSRGLSRFTT